LAKARSLRCTSFLILEYKSLLNYLPCSFCISFQLSVVIALPANTAGFSRFGINDHQIGNMDSSFLFYDTYVGILCTGLCMPRNNVRSFYKGALLISEYFQHFTFLAFVIARDNAHLVTFFQVQFLLLVLLPFHVTVPPGLMTRSS